MTAPKQEKWIASFRHRLNVSMIGAIGAVFDFYSGTQKRAPDWVQRSGFEWLYRFFREPGRLWERNLHSAPIFLWRVLREKARRLVSRAVSSPH
jgi:N-acetylglucosaminyldiphosphoundecaprenol N-acetyl-beta-D-mannosaminyltransferase